jgi:hypothetical protein
MPSTLITSDQLAQSATLSMHLCFFLLVLVFLFLYCIAVCLFYQYRVVSKLIMKHKVRHMIRKQISNQLNICIDLDCVLQYKNHRFIDQQRLPINIFQLTHQTFDCRKHNIFSPFFMHQCQTIKTIIFCCCLLVERFVEVWAKPIRKTNRLTQ